MAAPSFRASKPNAHPPPRAPPTTNGTTAGSAAPSTFPATKSQLYGATRLPYRPQPPSKPSHHRRRRSRRGCCCLCCLWLTLFLVALVFLVAIAGGIFYVLYSPHSPSFSVSSLRFSAFNLTASNQLSSHIELSVVARNPNHKIVFIYDTISISAASGDVDVGDGSLPAFVHGAENITVLKTILTSSGQSLDPSVSSDLKKKSTIPIEIEIETKAGVKIWGLKTKKIGIGVSCTGISVAVPRGKGKASAALAGASCKAEIRIKIWKWTV